MAKEGTTYYCVKPRNMTIWSRHLAFQNAMGDPAQPVVSVFEPLTTQQLQELQLVRKISRELQIKKQNDMIKAKAANIK